MISRVPTAGRVLIGALLLVGLRPASATLIDAIGTLSAGDQYRVAFVTSGTFNATSTTPGTYNTDVQTAALAGSITGGLGLSWDAWVSAGSTSALANTGITPGGTGTVYVFNTRGDIIAMSDSDLLDGALLQPISFDENGASLGTTVWTGTNADGSAATGDTLGSQMAVYGKSQNIDSGWLDVGIAAVSQPFSLYGLSSLATVTGPKQNTPSDSTIPIPEPASDYLAALALVGLAWTRRRRRIDSR